MTTHHEGSFSLFSLIPSVQHWQPSWRQTNSEMFRLTFISMKDNITTRIGNTSSTSQSIIILIISIIILIIVFFFNCFCFDNYYPGGGGIFFSISIFIFSVTWKVCPSTKTYQVTTVLINLRLLWDFLALVVLGPFTWTTSWPIVNSNSNTLWRTMTPNGNPWPKNWIWKESRFCDHQKHKHYMTTRI